VGRPKWRILNKLFPNVLHYKFLHNQHNVVATRKGCLNCEATESLSSNPRPNRPSTLLIRPSTIRAILSSARTPQNLTYTLYSSAELENSISNAIALIKVSNLAEEVTKPEAIVLYIREAILGSNAMVETSSRIPAAEIDALKLGRGFPIAHS